MKWLYANRGFILFFLICIETLFAISIFDEVTTQSITIGLLKSASSFVLMLFVIFLFLKLEGVENVLRKSFFIKESSPLLSMEYDFIKKKWHINNVTKQMLNLNIVGKLADYRNIFDGDDWNEVVIFSLKEKPMAFKKAGTLLSGGNTYKFFAKYIKNETLQLSSLLIWLFNWDKEIAEKNEVIELFKRYRVISYEQDLLINSLPFPVWRRNEKGEITLYNQACQKLLQKNVNITADTDSEEVQNMLPNLFKQGMQSGSHVTTERHFIVNNRIETIRFTEHALSDELGSIGFALDARDQELLEKNVDSLIATLEKVMELSRSAIIIIDSDKKVTQFNQVFINYFEIDPNWLAEKPSYSLLLDKLRENKKLPEVNNYRSYKIEHLRLISELVSAYHELLHLQNGQTLRFSVIPTSTGDTILIYDNITDILNVERSYNELASVYKTILSCIDEAIIIVGQNGKIKLYNQKALSFLNLNAELLETFPHYLDIFSKLGLNVSIVELINDKVINTLEYQKDAEIELNYQMQNLHLKLKALPDFSALLLFTQVVSGVVDNVQVQKPASND